jgi:hypothetical protein
VRNNQVAKLFALLLFGILFVFSFSHIATTTYERVFSESEVFNKGTIIGSVDVSGLTKEQAVERITTRLNSWFQSSVLSLHYKEVEKRIESEMFRFSIQESVNTAVNGKASPLVIHIQEPVYKETIGSFHEDLLIEGVDHISFSKELLNVLTTMKTGDFDFNLLDFINKELQSSVISTTTVPVSEQQSIFLTEALEHKNQLVIPAMSRFSLLDFVDEQSITLPNESLSILGSALYKTILFSNFEVVERYTSRQLPDYIELGYEANITKGKRDFAFYNPNTTDYVVNITISDNIISTELIGAPLLYQYEIERNDRTTFPPKSILQFDPKLPLGTSKIVERGEKGFLVKVMRKKLQENGDLLESELISEDFYPPIHQVIISSVLSKSVPIEEEEENTVEDTDRNEENEDEETGTILTR